MASALVARGEVAHVAGELAGVGADRHDGEAELLLGDAGRGERVGGVAEHEDALAGEIGRVDRARVPGQARLVGGEECLGLGRDLRRRAKPGHLCDEVARGADADRHDLGGGLTEGPLQPLGRLPRDLGIEHHVEVGGAEAGEIGRGRAFRRHHVHVDPQTIEQALHLDDDRRGGGSRAPPARGCCTTAPCPPPAALAWRRASTRAGRRRRARSGRRSPPRPSSPSSGRRAAPAAPPAPADAAPRRGRRDRPGSARRCTRRRRASPGA